MASRGARQNSLFHVQIERYLFDLDMAERVVEASELQAGDVLLFRSTPFMSRLIRRLDSSSINHVAMVVGPGMVLEAAPGGVARRSLAAAMKDVEYAIVRRASGVSAQGCRVIAESAMSLGSGSYSYETVILLALHIALGEQIPRSVRPLLAGIVNCARAAVELIIRSKQIPLFCSELIWLAFHKAERTLVIPQYFDRGLAALSAPANDTGWPEAATRSVAADPERLAEEAMRRWDDADPGDAPSDTMPSLARFLAALNRCPVLNERRLPRLGDDLIGLVPYVGRATTPQDLYQEESVLTTVGRLPGPAL
jgi:hypothetical protein